MSEQVKKRWATIVVNGNITKYIVSDQGDVVTSDTMREVSSFIDKDGYCIVRLTSYGKIYNRRVARLVAQAFVANPDNKPEVNHKDACKRNNNASNLEWVTNQENIDHSVKLGLNGKRGEDNPHSIYTDEQVHAACKLMEDPTKRPIEISKTTGISTSMLHNIRYKGAWIHISENYSFPNVNFNIGVNNINVSHTEKQIHDACFLLQEGKHTIDTISKYSGVSVNTIDNIKARRAWVHISKDYDIPWPKDSLAGTNHPNNKYSDDQIKKVCELLMVTTNTLEMIEEATGVSKHTAHRIYKGEQWNDIAKDYTFPKRTNAPPKNSTTEPIVKMLNEGKTNKEITDILLSDFGLSDRRRAQQMVSDIKNRYITKLVSAPTTIENTTITGEIPYSGK